jgi:hypothetical protein
VFPKRRAKAVLPVLAGPSLFSVHELRLSPDFDLIRDNSRYQALVRRYGGSGLDEVEAPRS